MGAINNAFNQAVGTVAGAALAIKHAQETDLSKVNSAELSALNARNQSREADAVANEAETEANKEAGDGGVFGQLYKAKLDEKKAREAVKHNSSFSDYLDKMEDLEAAQKARDKLENKYKAIKDLRDRVKEQRAYADKATKIALDQKQKYEKRWGGNK